MIDPPSKKSRLVVLRPPMGVHREVTLDGERVPTINSRLRGKPERLDPVPLRENAGKCFQGSIVLGMGFTLTPQRRDELIRKDPRNAERIFPYIGGEEVTTNPTQKFHRYVINFGSMSLKEAERWPDLIQIVKESVKPQRHVDNRENYRKFWWRFAELRPGLYRTIAPLERCLVASRVTTHLCFAFQPPDRVFANTLCVCALADYARFATVQSRVHESWARLLSSSMENNLRYSTSDCFETFPFPSDSTLTPTSRVEQAGQALYEARAHFMVDTQQGLTKTYNALKDPLNDDPRVVEMRRLHEAMDRAVLDAYGWEDIEVPPYGTPVSMEERRALERFEDEVLDRLFTLNEERARLEQEEAEGPSLESVMSGLEDS